MSNIQDSLVALLSVPVALTHMYLNVNGMECEGQKCICAISRFSFFFFNFQGFQQTEDCSNVHISSSMETLASFAVCCLTLEVVIIWGKKNYIYTHIYTYTYIYFAQLR